MSAVGTSKGILEIAKFFVYVSVPVGLTYAVATDSKTLHKLMGYEVTWPRLVALCLMGAAFILLLSGMAAYRMDALLGFRSS